MSPYVIFILVLLIGCYVISKSSIKNPTNGMLFFAWLVLTIFGGANDATYYGTDVSVYFAHAQRAVNSELDLYLQNNPFEQGFSVYLWNVSNFFGDPQAFFFVQYGIVNAIMMIFIKKYSDNPFYGIIAWSCLGGYSFYFTAMRQAVAMSICLIAFMLMSGKRRLLAILCVLFATFFHRSSIVFLPALFLFNLKLSRNNTILVIIGCIIVSIFLGPLVEFGNEYMDKDYGTGYIFNSYIGAIINIAVLIFTIVTYTQNRDGSDNKPIDSAFYYCTFLALTFYLMRFNVLAMERVSFYFLPIAAIACANCVNMIKVTTKQSVIPALYVILSPILLLVRWVGTDYRWIWESF